jgi:hypothetical protein
MASTKSDVVSVSESEKSAVAVDSVVPELIPDSLVSVLAFLRYFEQTFRNQPVPGKLDECLVHLLYYDHHEVIAMMQLGLDLPRGSIQRELHDTLRFTTLNKLVQRSPLLQVVERDDDDDDSQPKFRFRRQIDTEFFIARRIARKFLALDEKLVRDIFNRNSNIRAMARLQISDVDWHQWWEIDISDDDE